MKMLMEGWLDQMTSNGPFQPKPFYDVVIMLP